MYAHVCLSVRFYMYVMQQLSFLFQKIYRLHHSGPFSSIWIKWHAYIQNSVFSYSPTTNYSSLHHSFRHASKCKLKPCIHLAKIEPIYSCVKAILKASHYCQHDSRNESNYLLYFSEAIILCTCKISSTHSA